MKTIITLIIIGAGKSVTIRAADGYNGPLAKVGYILTWTEA